LLYHICQVTRGYNCNIIMDKTEPIPTIRIAGPDDAALLAEIGARAFYEAYHLQNDPADMAAYLADSFSPAKQAAELAESGSTFLIAEQEGVPVGFVRLHDCPAPEFVNSSRPLELVRIYTLRPWIGQGIGGLMMQSCIDLAVSRGYDAIWLSVWTKNPRAVAFYRRWGYEIAGTARFKLGTDIQEDYIMVRRLEDRSCCRNQEPGSR